MKSVFLVILFLSSSITIGARDQGTFISWQRANDFALTADPEGWKDVPGVITQLGRRGEKVSGHRTEIKSVWTRDNLYLLFVCNYIELNLKPNPTSTSETNELWEWDVAEAFIGADFNRIKHYREYQVSPQGEWVDLDIDRGASPPKHDVSWNSGYQVKARLDEKNKVWIGEMKIPFASLGISAPANGTRMRANFYRIQGPKPRRQFLNWRAVNSDNFHTPEAFGILQLGGKPASVKR